MFAQRAFGSPSCPSSSGFCMLAAGVTSVAGLALAFSGSYLSELVDVPPVPAALVFLVLVALLNARGIKESLRANLVMTVVEVSGLLLVVVARPPSCWAAGDGTPGRVLEFDGGVLARRPILGGRGHRVLLLRGLRDLRQRRGGGASTRAGTTRAPCSAGC